MVHIKKYFRKEKKTERDQRDKTEELLGAGGSSYIRGSTAPFFCSFTLSSIVIVRETADEHCVELSLKKSRLYLSLKKLQFNRE